jgi:hypothetical protein
MERNVMVSKANCAQFCRFAADCVQQLPSSEAPKTATLEVEYRVALDEPVFAGVVKALDMVPDVAVQRRTYSAVHFPANVRACLDAEAHATAALVERKTSKLRLRVGTVGDAPLWGVVALETPLEGAAVGQFSTAARRVLSGGMDQTRAVCEAGLPDTWLQTAWGQLEWVGTGKGKGKQFLSCPGLVQGRHLAFADVRVPALPAPDLVGGGAAFVPIHVRQCRRTSFQWDPAFRIDCTIMRQGTDRVLHHLEVECLAGGVVSFPTQLTDLLDRLICRTKMSH